MQVISRVLAVVACVAVSVAGHAVVVTPTPFNTNPSKTFGCGGASAGPLNVIPTGGTVNWKLIAGDGAGDIRMLIDPAGGGGGAFPTSYQNAPAGAIITVPLTGGTTPSVVGTTYSFDFVLPAGLTCTGGGSNAVCTAQISSTSNWVSCFSFTKTAPTQSGGASTGAAQQQQGNCVTITTPLTTCSMLTGKTVWVPLGSDINDLDSGVAATLTQNLPNQRVFWAQPQSPDVPTPCVNSYKDYLCAQALVPCNALKSQPTTAIYGQQPCQSVCKEFTCWCDLNDLHAFLYDCTTINNAASDSVGSCSGFKRKYGPNNSTCIPRATSSTAGTCPNGDCGAASHSASHSSLLLAAVVSVVAAALYANNH